MTTNSHGQRYCVGLAAPVQKDAPELLGSFERFWRTSKTSPMERECTSAICLAISLLRYQSREETTGLYSACLPHWGWAEAGIILPVTLGVQMEVSYCSSPVSLSVVTRAGLTRPPYAHDSKWTMLTSPALESKAIMTSLGGLDGGREVEDPMVCHALESPHARWGESGWDWFRQKGSEVASKSYLLVSERLMSGI